MHLIDLFIFDHFIQYLVMNQSTSTRRGIDGIAPSLVMHRKAALLPNYIALRQLLSLFYGEDQSNQECLTANAPVKQSPAPTVSIILQSFNICLFIDVTTFPRTNTVFVIIAEPLLPSFNKTRRLGCLVSNLVLISLVIRFKSNFYQFITIELSNLSNSVQLGEIYVMLSRSSSEIGSSLPPQSRMTILDCEYAYLAAARLISMGTSF